MLLAICLCGCGKKTTKEQYTCTISVDCKTILANMDSLDDNLKNHVPKDGVIVEAKKVTFEDGDTVFDILEKTLKEENILMEASFTGKSAYIEGINNFYEFSCGELSGWMYSVNGEFPNVSCSDYKLKNNDIIEWRYTCNLGEDLK